MKIIVIDGKGGRLGKSLIEGIRETGVSCEIIAVGTNAMATQAMLLAKADGGATGESAVVYNAKDADYIVGPIGIIVSGALLGEISPEIACAITQSRAKKILLPENKCGVSVVGAAQMPFAEQIRLAVAQIAAAAGVQQ